MNHKQKLGYMALGAGILALGIIIGQVITPDIEAQNNGVFDKITCRGIGVIDKDGEMTILVQDGAVTVSGKDGGSAHMSTTEHGGVVGVFTNRGKPQAAMGVDSFGNGAVYTWDRNGHLQ